MTSASLESEVPQQSATVIPLWRLQQRNQTPEQICIIISGLRRFIAIVAFLSMVFLMAPCRGAVPTTDVLVYRTMMPDCGPSSFAVALTRDLGFSFDPGRGGINYIWRGEFVDLEPTWKGKINKPAALRGLILYRENVRFPLRFGAFDREPIFEFKGYALSPHAIEFHYSIDEVSVREEIRASPNGRGLVRHFQVNEPAGAWSYATEPQKGVTISSSTGRWNEPRTALIGARESEFSVQIEFETTQR